MLPQTEKLIEELVLSQPTNDQQLCRVVLTEIFSAISSLKRIAAAAEVLAAAQKEKSNPQTEAVKTAMGLDGEKT